MHVIQRGNNRTQIFRAADDFARFRELLLETSRRFGCAIHAYVFMTNHAHLLITPEDDHGPSRMMQAIGQRYVRGMNARHRRTGTLWEGRFRSSLIDSERYLLACSRYIELNPVRACMVDAPDRYAWSSYRFNAYGATDELLTPHSVYHGLGSSPADRQAAYRALFRVPLRSRMVDSIRDATNRGSVLGGAHFRERVEAILGRSVVRFPHGGDRRSASFQRL
jgi:putative transposase